MTSLLRKLETLEDSGTSRISRLSRLSRISSMPRSSRCSRNARLAIVGFSPRSILKPCISRLQKALPIDVSSAWYFITICAEGHAPWVADEVKIDRAVAPRPPISDVTVEELNVD